MSRDQQIVDFIKQKFPNKDFIPLHEPIFNGNERKYVIDTIESTFVSSVGAYVDKFEGMIAEVAGTKYAVATVNGTAALHIALKVAGVSREDEVISQALTFIATTNAISYERAFPVFLDVDLDTMGLSPKSLSNFLTEFCIKKDDKVYNRLTGRRIGACVPMHTFGLPTRIDQIKAICDDWSIPLIEDAAESIGSYYNGKPTGGFGLMGIFSLNGNKIVTSGGGGAVVTNDEKLAKQIKHLTTQAKVAHRWGFNHDMIGFNYRLPNINAALACAQLEQLDTLISKKRKLATEYHQFFQQLGVSYKAEIEGCESNYWLNAVEFENYESQQQFLELSNDAGVMTRPIWNLMSELEMYRNCQSDSLENSKFLAKRIVNIPSSCTNN